jgi:hypothetical protein
MDFRPPVFFHVVFRVTITQVNNRFVPEGKLVLLCPVFNVTRLKVLREKNKK